MMANHIYMHQRTIDEFRRLGLTEIADRAVPTSKIPDEFPVYREDFEDDDSFWQAVGRAMERKERSG